MERIDGSWLQRDDLLHRQDEAQYMLCARQIMVVVVSIKLELCSTAASINVTCATIKERSANV